MVLSRSNERVLLAVLSAPAAIAGMFTVTSASCVLKAGNRLSFILSQDVKPITHRPARRVRVGVVVFIVDFEWMLK